MVLGVLDQGGSREAQAKGLADIYLALPRKSRFDISPAYTLIRKMKGLDVRLIHTYGWMSGAAGLVAARLYRLPIINGGFREAPVRLSFREKINRWCALRSNLIVSNTHAALKSYGLGSQLRAEPRVKPRIKVIYNGIDFSRFPKAVSKNSPDIKLCMVANFGSHKDHPTMIEAFSFVKDRFPGIKLILVGQDIGTLDATRKLVASRGLEDCVVFVTNTIEPEPIIAGCDIGILASLYGEGISNSILEYMYLKRPVIATNAGGNPELVRDGETGILTAKQSPEALAEAICYLLTHPDQAQKMGEAGHVYVRDHFALERMVNEYECLYHGLLSA